MGISLLANEQILKKTYPHIFSMFYLYIYWLFLCGVGLGGMYFHQEILGWLYALPLPQIEKFIPLYYFALWSLLLLLPSGVMAFYRINWRWLFLTIAIVTGAISSFFYRKDIFFYLNQVNFPQEMAPLAERLMSQLQTGHTHNYFLMIVGVLGLIASDLYRRSHRYYITDRRIVASFGFINASERDVLYSKVDDLILQQGILGRLMGFGTIIPISASGLGTGSEQVFAFAGGEGKLPLGPTMKVSFGGGKSVVIPRAPSFYSLYGVFRPQTLKNVILDQMHQREYRNVDYNKY